MHGRKRHGRLGRRLLLRVECDGDLAAVVYPATEQRGGRAIPWIFCNRGRPIGAEAQVHEGTIPASIIGLGHINANKLSVCVRVAGRCS